MTTLTLAVENHFPPDVAPASSQSSLSHKSVPCSRSAPGTLADISTIYSSSLPDLIPLKKAPAVPLSLAELPKDDSALSVSWVRPAQSVMPHSQSLTFPQTSLKRLEMSSEKLVMPSEKLELPSEIPPSEMSPLPVETSPLPMVPMEPGSPDVSPTDLTKPFIAEAKPVPGAVLVEGPADKPRAISEGAIRTPLKKLKSSLKLPHLSRVQSASSLSPKSVKFASRLENVKMFDGKDSPSSVSLQNTPSGSPNSSSSFVNDYFSIPRSFGDLMLSDSESESDDEVAQEMSYRINSSNFVAPKNIYDKKKHAVYLQKAVLSADKKSLVLIVMCQNIAFEKALSLKLTFNDWKSQLIFNNAVYVSSFASANFDQFKFTIPLTHLPSAINPQFCIKYTVNHSTYWDNNDGRNYHFSLSAVAKAKASSRDKIALKAGSKDTFSYKPPTFSQTASFHLDSDLNIPKPEPAGRNNRSTNTDIQELVNKLQSVKESTESFPVLERPMLSRSTSLQPEPRPLSSRSSSLQTLRPRYSKSYKSKTAEPESPLGNKGLDRNSQSLNTSPVPMSVSDAALSQLSSKNTKNYVAKPVDDLKPSEIVSMSYADLLQKYCFNGAQNSSQSAVSSPFESMASSRNSSKTSMNSEYGGHSSPFQYSSGAFYI